MRIFFKAPVEMRSASLRTYVARRAHFAFGRFSDTIQTATVGFEDVNGPRGGIDKRCSVLLRLPGEPDIAVEAHHEDGFAAADLAMSKARRALLRRRDRDATGRARRFRPGFRAASLGPSPISSAAPAVDSNEEDWT